MKLILATLFFVLLVGLVVTGAKSKDKELVMADNLPREVIRTEVPDGLSRATFASGCFWCIEATYQETPGVIKSISGYAGGEEYNPTYEDVYKEITGHRESVMVYYDPAVISYEDLLAIFWQNIDPTDAGGQFFDRGRSYTTAIFYESDEQEVAAIKSLKDLEASNLFDKPIATSLLPYTTFYEAEEYHQDFYLKSPGRYQSYSGASGRKEFKERVWQQILKEQN